MPTPLCGPDHDPLPPHVRGHHPHPRLAGFACPSGFQGRMNACVARRWTDRADTETVLCACNSAEGLRI
jgi:hypothetical protein